MQPSGSTNTEQRQFMNAHKKPIGYNTSTGTTLKRLADNWKLKTRLMIRQEENTSSIGIQGENEMYRFVLYFLSSFVLTASVLARVDGGEDNDIATGGVLKLSTTCKGINVAHARFGNCGYGHFLGYSFGSGKTPGQSPVPLKRDTLVGGVDGTCLSYSIKTDYCGFPQMELVHDERGRLWRIALAATGNDEQMAKMARKVKDDLVLTYGFREQDWAGVGRGDAHGVCATLPGGLEVMILECRDTPSRMRLEVVVQNRRVLEPSKKGTAGLDDVNVDADI